MSFATEQETFWAGDFGSEYNKRNIIDKQCIAARVHLWGKILSSINFPLTSVLELGPNLGRNLDSLSILQPAAELFAVEINKEAVRVLRDKGYKNITNESILSLSPERTFDLVFTSGVLIHINPAELRHVYTLMCKSSQKYVCMIEYYNPVPVEAPYRGHAGKLFKRDFAGEFLEMHPEYTLLDYGFVYHRDPLFPADDATWFLMGK